MAAGGALTSAASLALLEDQDGVFSRAQARAVGVSRRVISRMVDRGLWQTIGPAVVVTHNGALTQRQKDWAGVLHAGPGGALFGLSSLSMHGLRGFPSPTVQTVAEHGRGRRDITTRWVSIKVHESVHMSDADIHPAKAPRRQRVARAAVDAAALAATDGQARAVIAAVVQQRLIFAEELRPFVVGRPTLPRHGLLLETIDDVAGGAESLPEMEWTKGIRRLGLPTPSRQRVIQHANRRYYLDADFDEWMVTVEINGGQHLDPRSVDYDDERRFVLSAGGRLVVDISSYIVRYDMPRAGLRTARALHARGWRPEPATLTRLQGVANQRGEELWLPRLIVPELDRPA